MGEPECAGRYARGDPPIDGHRRAATSDYTVIYEQAGDGSWGASVPDLGVFAAGDTRQGVEGAIVEAVRFHLAGLDEEGMEGPQPRITAGTVTA